ncbi:MFS transporter [Aliiglaciecola sp. LCG003]|uniref:MFS transporter n=1 Tax=Aliiglaciecola sp. LCG003 TaxID=3053655 RepID=UPI002572CEB7|nr:MFS transporter [Aliiglaciecola sp. LCG003]WJG09093.1 MFS transporter [Aliiglaciecola sp. LCG003]
MSKPNTSSKNAFRLLLSIASCTKLADLLASSKTTLPYILSASGAPSWLISILVPVKESGSMIPQWILKTWVSHKFENRSQFWRIGAAMQGLGILSLVPVIALLQGNIMAWSVFSLLLLTSFGRSICSLTMKDIQAETIDKGRRGRLIGLASSLSGGLTLISALIFVFINDVQSHLLAYSILLLGGCLFLTSIALSMPLHVQYQIKSQDKDKPISFRTLLSQEANLRHIVISRVLLMNSALIVPYVVAASSMGDSSDTPSTLPYFIGLSALASLLSSFIWGVLADKGALLTLRVAATICTISSFVVAYGLGQLSDNMILLLFFILMLGHAGIRTARKTYLLDITERSNRTEYVAAANTCVGLSLLTIGGIYALIYQLLGEQIIYLMGFFMLLGLIQSVKLQKVH